MPTKNKASRKTKKKPPKAKKAPVAAKVTIDTLYDKLDEAQAKFGGSLPDGLDCFHEVMKIAKELRRS